MASIFSELKRRNVFRVGAAYIVVAWLLLQLTDIVFENLGAPGWVMRVIMLLLAIGLPVALLLAWAFELTPEGVRRDIDDDSTSSRSLQHTRLFYGALGFLVVLALGLFAWQPFAVDDAANSSRSVDAPVAATDTTYRSIAILPFESFSKDPEDQFFADGLADALLNKLAQLDTLTVIARNSSFQFKGENVDVRTIGESLGVPTVVEGSVQRVGDQVRVIAQLVSTETGAHWWSDTFDDSFDNIFELQDRIAANIAEQLQITISERDEARMLRNGTRSPEAYEILMRANAIELDFDTGTYDESGDRVLRLLKEVVEIDPGYALGWAQLADHYCNLGWLYALPEQRGAYIDLCHETALRAIDADSEEEAGHDALASAFRRKGLLAEAEAEFNTVLALNPNHAGALSGLGLVKLSQRKPTEAYRLFSRSVVVDPASETTYRQLYFASFWLGRIEEGFSWLEKGIDRHPDSVMLHSDLAGAWISSTGRYDKAAQVITQLLQESPTSRWGMLRLAYYWLFVDELQRAESWTDALAHYYPERRVSRRLQILIAARKGNFAVAREMTQSLPDAHELQEKAETLAVLCLFLEDQECAEENVRMLEEHWREEAAEEGEISPRRLVSRSLIRAAVLDPASRATDAGISSSIEMMRDWPFLESAGVRLPTKEYRMAIALTLRGDHAEAVDELTASLDLPDGGILAADFFDFPPEQSIFLKDLRDRSDFAEWFRKFEARRLAMREDMIALETNGEIARPPFIPRQ
ncbi:MAG: tetratricopeptide repeat protein [Gammaproteobacteria bacterium]|nr:tetratricopeptide repeat protein [Gammaproteobacteria bacterium]MDH3849177.1 tetratricopeptide repeat protein [Gammaproteobacteria bacterium]